MRKYNLLNMKIHKILKKVGKKRKNFEYGKKWKNCDQVQLIGIKELAKHLTLAKSVNWYDLFAWNNP